MTVLLPYGRTLSKQLHIRSGLLTRLISTNSTSRVWNRKHGALSTPNDGRCLIKSERSYATATKPASRPKAHTGRATAKRSTVVKQATKGTTTKSKAKPKPKPKKKAAKPKPKPKAKPKKRAPRPLTEAGIARKASKERAELKKKALLYKEPKRLSETAWTLFNATATQKGSGGVSLASTVIQNSASFKALNPEEREALNHQANQNAAKNEQEYKKWVQSHTPVQVREANNARLILLREAKANSVKHLAPFRKIKDDRLPKRPPGAHQLFLQDRYATGDYKGMTAKEAFGLIHREFTGLSATEKKKYDDDAKSRQAQYIAEHKTVYGVAPGRRLKGAATA